MSDDECLLLCHRIPYPPDRGDKIRSFHLLRYLARRFRVHLGAFVDDPVDWSRAEGLNRYTTSHCLRPLTRPRMAWRMVGGLLRGRPLSVAIYQDRVLREWVRERLRGGVECVVVFSSATATLVDLPEAEGVPRFLDYVDVDSQKWRQYAETLHRGPKAWIYAREHRLLQTFELEQARHARRVLFISPEEAALFRAQGGDGLPVDHYPNGVDVDYFDPNRGYPDPFQTETRQLVFTGVMDYPPNVDAVCWFTEAVLPALRRRHPEVGFTIVGARPVEAVRALAERAGVTVTGRVEDVRPYLAHAAAVVAPMRVARGVQNKVLEAMAMDRPVLVTAAAAEGLGEGVEHHIAVIDSPEAQVARLDEWLSGAVPLPRPRSYVVENFSWERVYARLDELLQ